MKTKEDKKIYHDNYNREWYKRNKEKVKQYDLIQRSKKQAENILKNARAAAKKKNLEFNLDISDIKIPNICPIMGCKITNLYGHGRVQTNPSIDRIDPTKGYTKENIQIISDMANRMKQDATKEQLLAFAFGIIELHRQQQHDDSEYE